MLPKLLFQGALFAASAQAQAQKVMPPASDITSEPKNPNEGMEPIHGVLMEDCQPSISVCGRQDQMKVEHVPRYTTFYYNNITTEKLTTLSTETEWATSYEYTTRTVDKIGWCRNTTTLVDDSTTTITLNLTVTTTREFVPVVRSTTVIPTTIDVTAIDQCIVPGGIYVPPTAPPMPGPKIPDLPKKPADPEESNRGQPPVSIAGNQKGKTNEKKSP